jgi:subtilase family serine protease
VSHVRRPYSFLGSVFASRKPRPRPAARSVRLQLEELETRALLSVGVQTPTTDPSTLTQSSTSTTQTATPSTTQTTTTTTTATTTATTTSTTSTNDPTATPDITITPMGTSGAYTYYNPNQIRTAYNIPSNYTGAGETIAIVDAFGDPNIKADLSAFDSNTAYGMGSTAYGSNDNGNPSFLTVATPFGPAQSTSSSNASGWATETALDVEWAHAVAPQANILLVQSPSDSLSNLLSSAQWAANQPGVVAVSMSWGSNEFSGEQSYDSYFSQPTQNTTIGNNLTRGVTYLASSGDNGAWYGPEWPAVSPNVISIGGTSLYLTSSNSYSSESGWSGSGGGYSGYDSRYSSYEVKPTWQTNGLPYVERTSPDVAYDANPYTGFTVAQNGGWYIVGGTSAGSPQWAGIIALADQARAANGLGSLSTQQAGTDLYNLPSTDLHDVTTGSNGYRAGTGYDLVTGRGTPIVNLVVGALANPTAGNFSSTSTTQTSTTTSSGTGTHTGHNRDDLGAPISDTTTDTSSSTGSSTTAPTSGPTGTATPAATTSTATTVGNSTEVRNLLSTVRDNGTSLSSTVPTTSINGTSVQTQVSASLALQAIESSPGFSSAAPLGVQGPQGPDLFFQSVGVTYWNSSPQMETPAPLIHLSEESDVIPDDVVRQILLGQQNDPTLIDNDAGADTAEVVDVGAEAPIIPAD